MVGKRPVFLAFYIDKLFRISIYKIYKTGTEDKPLSKLFLYQKYFLIDIEEPSDLGDMCNTVIQPQPNI